MSATFSNCADETTPEGAFAYVGDGVTNHSGLGYWTAIGSGARIGHGSKPGDWSKIGHFARIGNGVAFGPWACVGIDAVVDSGCTLTSHEYVPGGMRRHRNGRLSQRQVDIEDQVVISLYDRWCTAIPAGCYRNDEYASLKAVEDDYAQELAAALPAFLARRNVVRQPRWWSRLLLTKATT